MVEDRNLIEYYGEHWRECDIWSNDLGLFVLWAVHERLCLHPDDFRAHFGNQVPVSDLLECLEKQEFLQQTGSELILTDAGHEVISSLHIASVPDIHKHPSEILATIDSLAPGPLTRRIPGYDLQCVLWSIVSNSRSRAPLLLTDLILTPNTSFHQEFYGRVRAYTRMAAVAKARYMDVDEDEATADCDHEIWKSLNSFDPLMGRGRTPVAPRALQLLAAIDQPGREMASWFFQVHVGRNLMSDNGVLDSHVMRSQATRLARDAAHWCHVSYEDASTLFRAIADSAVVARLYEDWLDLEGRFHGWIHRIVERTVYHLCYKDEVPFTDRLRELAEALEWAPFDETEGAYRRRLAVLCPYLWFADRGRRFLAIVTCQFRGWKMETEIAPALGDTYNNARAVLSNGTRRLQTRLLKDLDARTAHTPTGLNRLADLNEMLDAMEDQQIQFQRRIDPTTNHWQQMTDILLRCPKCDHDRRRLMEWYNTFSSHYADATDFQRILPWSDLVDAATEGRRHS